MIKRGTMQPVKKVLGVALITLGIARIMQIQNIIDLAHQNEMIVTIIFLAAGYFLFISGRRL